MARGHCVKGHLMPPRLLAALKCILWVSVPGLRAEVLVARLQSGAEPSQFEAVPANWNQAIDDSGQGAFAGYVHYDENNQGGCRPIGPGVSNGHLVLVDAGSMCSSFAVTTARASEAGARGVIFYQGSPDREVSGMSLGDDAPPTIRAVMIGHRHGITLRDAIVSSVAMGQSVYVDLRAGVLISEDAYEEQFIFRVDEISATRAANFLWHTHPEMLPNANAIPLSSQFTRMGIHAPEGWFSSAPRFVPMFNPSLYALDDGSFLTTLRMSNGPGCPSVRRSGESSMDTRVFRNEMVLAHIDAASLAVTSHVIVEVPDLICRFDEDTKVHGRRFLEEVRGPMDVRITAGSGGEAWVSFYAERNVDEGGEVVRGIHAAPLHVSWRSCSDGAHSSGGNASQVASSVSHEFERGGWELHGQDVAFIGDDCQWLQQGPSTSIEVCMAACDAVPTSCNTVNFRPGEACVLRKCAPKERASQLRGWQAWRRRDNVMVWESAGKSRADSLEWLGQTSATTSTDCQSACEALEGCWSVAFSQRHSLCFMYSAMSRKSGSVFARSEFEAAGDWEVWRRRLVSASADEGDSQHPFASHGTGGESCLDRAWIVPEELIAFPAANGVEKNWNMISASRERLVIEYHVEPHIVVEASLVTPSDRGLVLAAFGVTTVSRWPYDVLHGLTSVRGGYCCAELSRGLWQGRLRQSDEADLMPKGSLLLGVGHLQRIRQPFDQAPGDLDRFRRQAKSRTYHNFFYLLRGEAPFDVVAVSTEWCISMNGMFSRPWRKILAQGEDACEAIQFASGLALRENREVVVAYGINDCEADLLVLPLARVLDMLRPVRSDLNVSLDDVEII